jgi:hypothetical protein
MNTGVTIGTHSRTKSFAVRNLHLVFLLRFKRDLWRAARSQDGAVFATRRSFRHQDADEITAVKSVAVKHVNWLGGRSCVYKIVLATSSLWIALSEKLVVGKHFMLFYSCVLTEYIFGDCL